MSRHPAFAIGAQTVELRRRRWATADLPEDLPAFLPGRFTAAVLAHEVPLHRLGHVA